MEGTTIDNGNSVRRTTKVNLEIPAELGDTFAKAQQKTVRFLKLTTNSEQTLIVNKEINFTASPKEDFEIITIQSILTENEAAYLLFCLDDFTDGLKKEKLSWLFITWIPDGCRNRDKMLFSNSISQLKKNLGSRLFKTDYPASTLAHLSWHAYQYSLNPSLILSKPESFRKKPLESNGALLGFESLAFRVDSGVTTALKSFNKASIGDWYEFSLLTETVREETLAFHGTKQLKSFTAFQSLFSKVEPRIILTRLPKQTGGSLVALLLSCPESSSTYKKVTAAACKSCFLKECQRAGITVDKLTEFGGIEDDSIDDTMQQYVFDHGTGPNIQGFDVGGDGGASIQVVMMHSKPARPGKKRGRR